LELLDWEEFVYRSLKMHAIIRSIKPGGTPSGNKSEWQIVVFQLSIVLNVQISETLGSPGPRRLGRKKNFGGNNRSDASSNATAW
jgi:hypothetical protein